MLFEWPGKEQRDAVTMDGWLTCNTDGGGVMHSTLRAEYVLALTIMQAFIFGGEIRICGRTRCQPALFIWDERDVNLLERRNIVTKPCLARLKLAVELAGQPEDEIEAHSSQRLVTRNDLLPEVRTRLTERFKPAEDFMKSVVPHPRLMSKDEQMPELVFQPFPFADPSYAHDEELLRSSMYGTSPSIMSRSGDIWARTPSDPVPYGRYGRYAALR